MTTSPIPLTPAQLRIFDELLAIGGPRPVAPFELVGDLNRRISDGVSLALGQWNESTLWLSKAGLGATRRCEGQMLVDSATPRTRGLHKATAIGLVVHRAIQIAHTHTDNTPERLVHMALAGSRSEEQFAEFWDDAEPSVQSDVIVEAVNRLCGFLDTFPPLDPAWVPRFEDSTVARIGRLVLAARPDLTLGRPRGDGRQTMFLADFKSSDLRDEHESEAMFYALVATLRHGCPPYRSCVVSLASGEWTQPDVTADKLMHAADLVVASVVARVEVLTEQRPPTLTPGFHCGWCPARETCPANTAWHDAGRPSEHSIAVVGVPWPDTNTSHATSGSSPISVDTAPPTDAGTGGIDALVATQSAIQHQPATQQVVDSEDNPWLVD